MNTKKKLSLLLIVVLALSLALGTFAFYKKTFISDNNKVRAARFVVDSKGTLDEDEVFDLTEVPIYPGVKLEVHEFIIDKTDTEVPVEYTITVTPYGELFEAVAEGDSPVNLTVLRKVGDEWEDIGGLEDVVVIPDNDVEQFRIDLEWIHSEYDIEYQGKLGTVKIEVKAIQADWTIYTGEDVEEYVQVGTFSYNPNHSGNELVDITTMLNVQNLPFDDIDEIKIELLDGERFLASRVAKGGQINKLKEAAPTGKFSCSFVFGRESGSNEYWTSTSYDGTKPSKGVITITSSKRNAKYIAEKEYTGRWAEYPAVIAMIDDLPAINEITIEDKAAVEAARDAYEALPKNQKPLVTNLDKLEAAEAKIAELEKELEEYTVSFDLLAKFTDEKLMKPSIEIKDTKTNEVKNVTGTSHNLSPGTYDYKISIPGYEEKSGSFTIIDKNVIVYEEYIPSVTVVHEEQYPGGNYNWKVSDPVNLGIEKQGSLYPAYQLRFKSANGTTIPKRYNTVFGEFVINFDKNYYAPEKVSQLDVLVYFSYNDLRGELINVEFPK